MLARICMSNMDIKPLIVMDKDREKAGAFDQHHHSILYSPLTGQHSIALIFKRVAVCPAGLYLLGV